MIGNVMNSLRFDRALGLTVALGLVMSAVPAIEASAAAAPTKQTLVARSLDGAAFDFDEYVDGDISVQVTNSAKKNVDVDDARNLVYYWTITPFDTAAASTRVPAKGFSTQTVDVAGKFIVPLPQDRVSGSYTLTAAVKAGKSGSPKISGTTLRALKVGDATTTFTDGSVLNTDPGTNSEITGALKLEDGTGLPGRLIDLGITRGTAGSDLEADAGFVLTPSDAPLDDLQVTTKAKGQFTALLADPAEDGQGTELGDVLDAVTATTPDIGNADATPASLAVDFVTDDSPPAGTTAILDPLSAGTPGEALASELTITAPDDTFDVDPATPGLQGDSDSDRDPVEGQVYTISVDHGFFTTGHGPLPSVVGAPAGDLEQLGATLTGVTGPTGKIAFQVGVARDTGFDDDGKVTATITSSVGGVEDAESALWNSTNPMNGQVSVVLSAESEQENPVDPAVAGDRTYYDVLALDQFGNRAGTHLIDLAYTGDTDNWDYSDDSSVADFTASSDIWVTSFEPATITATGTWEDAPTDLYVDTAGNSDLGTATASDSKSPSFYEVNFNKSKFSITSSAKDVVSVGTAATQTVRVLDQLGNPVRGYEVQFFRYGPDDVSGNVLATRTTNAHGEATYKFIGNKVGRAIVTAGVTDGLGNRELKVSVRFGSVIKAKIAAGDRGKTADHLTVSANSAAHGARVDVYRVAYGKRFLAASGTLSRDGKATFTVTDRNRDAYTSYVAVVRSTTRTVADSSSTLKIR